MGFSQYQKYALEFKARGIRSSPHHSQQTQIYYPQRLCLGTTTTTVTIYSIKPLLTAMAELTSLFNPFTNGLPQAMRHVTWLSIVSFLAAN